MTVYPWSFNVTRVGVDSHSTDSQVLPAGFIGVVEIFISTFPSARVKRLLFISYLSLTINSLLNTSSFNLFYNFTK